MTAVRFVSIGYLGRSRFNRPLEPAFKDKHFGSNMIYFLRVSDALVLAKAGVAFADYKGFLSFKTTASLPGLVQRERA